MLTTRRRRRRSSISAPTLSGSTSTVLRPQDSVPGSGGTAPSPAPTPSPGHITIPGIVDSFYQNLLQTNPLYTQQLANLSAAGTMADSQRKQAIQKMLADFGYIPGGYEDKYGDINDLVRGLASANTEAGLSGYAQLGKNRDVQARGIKNDLAGRGLLSSGDLGYQLGQNEQQYMQSLSEAERQLLEQLTGFASQYTGAVSDIATQKTDAAQNAMQEILATNPSAPSDQANLLKNTVNKHGVGWYGLGGKLYDQTGNLLDIPTLIAAARQRRQQYLATHTRSQYRGTLAYRRLEALKQFLQNFQAPTPVA